MGKIAINIALIPPKEVVEKCIAINRGIVKRGGLGLVLGKKRNLPHVTLMQGVIDQSDVAHVEKTLDGIARSFSSVLLKVLRVNYRELPSPSSVLQVEKTPELQKLHEVIMNKCAEFVMPLNKAEVERNWFYEPVGDSTVEYVVNFDKKYAFDTYSPHITLGKGKAKEVELFEFTASKLTLCELGNRCTCAKVLYSIELKQL